MSDILVGLHRSTSVVSALIRWQTRSEYSHASLVCASDGTLLEALEGRGVIVERRLGVDVPREQVDLHVVRGLTAAEQAAMWQWALGQVGKGYDYVSVLRFVTRRAATRRSSGRWFCSELVHAAALHGAGVALQRMDSWRCAPDHLAISPLLERVA